MGQPWKHPKTGVYYLRKRLPFDLVTIVGRQIEKSFLRTKDVDEARRLHAEALATLEARWRNLRVGLLRPTPRKIAALAGEFYRSIAGNEGKRDGRRSPPHSELSSPRIGWTSGAIRPSVRTSVLSLVLRSNLVYESTASPSIRITSMISS
ncbi:DUF6538 domain-containing protein [Aureimonas pseudogalii]